MSGRDFLAEFDAAVPECQYPLVQRWHPKSRATGFFCSAQSRATGVADAGLHPGGQLCRCR